MDWPLSDSSRITHSTWTTTIFVLLLSIPTSTVLAGVLELTVLDSQTGKPLPARIRLTGPRGRHPKAGISRFHDHFLTYGFREKLDLAAGLYQYEITSGPEYLEQTGSFQMARDATDNKIVELKRFVKMKDHGWWSGDLWFQRKVNPLGIQALAEDLHVMGVACEATDFEIPQASKHLPNAPLLIKEWCTEEHDPTRENQTETGLRLFSSNDAKLHRQITNIAHWNLPSHIALGKIDSIIIHQPPAKGTALRESRPWDANRFPDADGEGRYHEFIYHQLLNAGFRIPPAAASGSGVHKIAPGTYRTYVFVDDIQGESPTASDWWHAIQDGKVIISNGPLMLPKVNGKLPGHEFTGSIGETIELQPTLTLHTRRKIDYLQFVKNGQNVFDIRLDEWARQGKTKLPKITFTKSGWMLIRAVTRTDAEYRYVSTGPYFVKIGNDDRISRQAVRFFVDWVYALARNLKKDKNSDGGAKRLRALKKTRDFWMRREELANAE